MHISIRLAEAPDWPTIVDFNCRLADESEGKRLDRQHVEPGVKALLADRRKGRYFVAVVDEGGVDEGGANQIAGQLMHTFEWSDWRNGDIWWLQSVYVHPDFRRQGVFRLLYEHLRSQAESDPGVVGLRLYVEDQNRRAYETYATLGFKPGGYFVMENMIRRSDLTPEVDTEN
ncbi:MAG: N-acetyltransferase [Planctomycetaceae bacterium]|nr:N-acetyltransferase [Planctomycetaceae bacterium]